MRVPRSLRRAEAPEQDRLEAALEQSQPTPATPLDGVRREQHRRLTEARTVADVRAVKDADGVILADLREALAEAGWEIEETPWVEEHQWRATSPAGEYMRYAWGDIELVARSDADAPDELDDDSELQAIAAAVLCEVGDSNDDRDAYERLCSLAGVEPGPASRAAEADAPAALPKAGLEPELRATVYDQIAAMGELHPTGLVVRVGGCLREWASSGHVPSSTAETIEAAADYRRLLNGSADPATAAAFESFISFASEHVVDPEPVDEDDLVSVAE